ncbi:MAG: M28 family peptidase [Hyphomonadaceae bacterium]
MNERSEASGGLRAVAQFARFWPLAVAILLVAAFWFRGAIVEPGPVRTENPPEAFDAGRAVERLTRVLDGTPHPVDSDALDAARERLLKEIGALGYAPDVHDETACLSRPDRTIVRCARVQNITFLAAPDGPLKGPVTVLTAHYDSVDASPGYGDDGVGVAVLLEIASLYKRAPPQGPVLFLITDGEEAALLGAQAFTDNKSYGYDVGAMINLEARGVRGPALMFETSRPNGEVVTPWAQHAHRPVANSMTAAVYERMPNSTDLSVHLDAGHAGINIAIGDGLAFYHTSRDDLAELDPRSVQHMGDQALAAANAFSSTGKAKPSDLVYSDFGTRFLVVVPSLVGMVILAGALLLSVVLFLRPARETSAPRFDVRAFLLPPLTLIAAGALAFVALWLFGLVRPEAQFWWAYPQAFNLVIFLLTVMAIIGLLALMGRRSSSGRLFSSGWFWFLAVGLALSGQVPGASILFVIPAIAFIPVAVATWVYPATRPYLWPVAAVATLIVFLPVIYLLDSMLGLAIAPVFGLVEALALAPFLPLLRPQPGAARMTLTPLAAGLVIASGFTLVLPAASRDTPIAYNYMTRLDLDRQTADLAVYGPYKAMPQAVRDAFSLTDDTFMPGAPAKVGVRRAPYPDGYNVTVETVADSRTAGKGAVTLRIAAPGARMIRVRAPASAGVRAARLQSAPETADLSQTLGRAVTFDCVGRSCNEMLVRFDLAPDRRPDGTPSALDADPAPWIVTGVWAGLPADSAPLAPPRPDTALPIQTGDTTAARLTFQP